MYFICDIDIKEFLHVIPQYGNIGLFEEPEQFEDFLDYKTFLLTETVQQHGGVTGSLKIKIIEATDRPPTYILLSLQGIF